MMEGKGQVLKLVNLDDDLQEEKDISKDYSEIVDELLNIANAARLDLGDGFAMGKNQRPSGWIDFPEIQLMNNKN